MELIAFIINCFLAFVVCGMIGFLLGWVAQISVRPYCRRHLIGEKPSSATDSKFKWENPLLLVAASMTTEQLKAAKALLDECESVCLLEFGPKGE